MSLRSCRSRDISLCLCVWPRKSGSWRGDRGSRRRSVASMLRISGRPRRPSGSSEGGSPEGSSGFCRVPREVRFHCWRPRARGPFSREDVSQHEFGEIDRSSRRRRADVVAEDQGSDGRGCGDGAREASESAARANGGAGRRAQRRGATRHGRECERIASVARAPSRTSAHNVDTVTTRAKIIARARAPTRPCGAARRAASAAQPDAA